MVRVREAVYVEGSIAAISRDVWSLVGEGRGTRSRSDLLDGGGSRRESRLSSGSLVEEFSDYGSMLRVFVDKSGGAEIISKKTQFASENHEPHSKKSTVWRQLSGKNQSS